MSQQNMWKLVVTPYFLLAKQGKQMKRGIPKLFALFAVTENIALEDKHLVFNCSIYTSFFFFLPKLLWEQKHKPTATVLSTLKKAGHK